MPRFHLNVINDLPAIDEEGLDLPDIEAATKQAVEGARELIAADIMAGRPVHQNHRVEIADGAGNVLRVVRFGEMVRLEP